MKNYIDKMFDNDELKKRIGSLSKWDKKDIISESKKEETKEIKKEKLTLSGLYEVSEKASKLARGESLVTEEKAEEPKETISEAVTQEGTLPNEKKTFLISVFGLDGKVARKYKVETDKREEDMKFELSSQLKKGEKMVVEPFAKKLPGADNLSEEALNDKKAWDAMQKEVKAFVAEKKLKLNDKQINRVTAHCLRNKKPGIKSDKFIDYIKTKVLKNVDEAVLNEGYTHYFNPKKSFTTEQWDAIMTIAKKAISEAKAKGIVIAGSDGTGEPVITPSMIVFNGDASEDLDHETFALTKKKGHGDFVKTARKPYDEVVVKILSFIHKNFPYTLELKSDGGMEVFNESVPTDETNKYLVKIYGLDGKCSRKYEVSTDKREEDIKFEISGQLKKGEKVIVKPFAKELIGRDNLSESPEAMKMSDADLEKIKDTHPLIYYSAKGNIEMVKKILSGNKSPEIGEGGEEMGISEEFDMKKMRKINPTDSPLIKAVKMGDISAVKAILEA
jgi:hypothetical protein